MLHFSVRLKSDDVSRGQAITALASGLQITPDQITVVPTEDPTGSYRRVAFELR